MAIPLTYLPSTLTSTTSNLSQEEREELERVRGASKEPIDFDFGAAYEELRDKGFDERVAVDTIARKLGEKANFDVAGARKAGFTNEQIVAKLIGRDPDDLESSPGYSAIEGVGRGIAAGAIPGAAGALVATGLAATGVGAPLIFGGALLTSMLVETTTGVGKKTEDLLFDKRQLLPGERSFDVGGRLLGAAATLTPQTKIAAAAIPEAVDFGSKRLMQRHLENRVNTLTQEAAAAAAGKAPKVPGQVKRREFAEKLVESLGKTARDTNMATFTAGEVVLNTIPAVAEGFAEAIAPGDDALRLGFGITSSVIPNPGLIAARGVGQGVKAAAADVKDKGFVQSAKGGFGAREAISDRRSNAAASYLAQAFQNSGMDPAKAADELDRLVAQDPELAQFLTPGQLANDPLLLIFEASARKNNPVLNQQTKNAGEKANLQLARYITALKNLEFPDDRLKQEALTLAARLEQEGLEKNLINLLDSHLIPAAAAADRLPLVRQGLTDTEIKINQGTILKEAAQEALKQAKGVQRKLYEEVNTNIEIDTRPLLEAYARLRSEGLLSPGAEIDSVLLKNLKIFGLGALDDEAAKLSAQLSKQIKTLQNKNNTLGRKFQEAAEKDPDAFGEFDFLVDSRRGPEAAGYDKRLAAVETNLNEDLPQRTKNNVLKLTKQAQNMRLNDANIQRLENELTDLAPRLADLEQPSTGTLTEVLAYRRDIRNMLRDKSIGIAPGVDVAVMKVLEDGVTNAINRMTQGSNDPNMQALQNAENYTKAMHDTFSRSFAGDLTRKARGGDFIDADVALEKTFAGSNASAYRRSMDILEAMRFEGVQDEALFGTVQGAMDAFLRNRLASLSTSATIVNPINGQQQTIQKLTPAAIEKFKQDYSEILKTIDPDGVLLNDLNDLDTAQVALEAALSQTSQRYNTHLKESALGRFLKADSAEAAINDVLSGKTPLSGLQKIAQHINRAQDISGDEIKDLQEGLFSAVLGGAMTRPGVTKPDGTVNFSKLYDILFDTAATKSTNGITAYPAKGPSIYDVLEKAGGVGGAEVDKLKDFLQRGKNLQLALDKGVDDFINFDETDAMKDFVARFAGAQITSELARAVGTSPTIQTTGAGAQLLRNQFINVPQMVFRDILVNVSRPGEATELARLLRKGASREEQGRGLQRAAVAIARNILGSPSYLASIGVRGVASEPQYETTPEVVEPVAPIAPPAPPAAAMTTPMPQQPVGQAMPPPAPTDPNLRQRYAAMYPNDPISGLIEQQAMQTGIGTLPN